MIIGGIISPSLANDSWFLIGLVVGTSSAEQEANVVNTRLTKPTK